MTLSMLIFLIDEAINACLNKSNSKLKTKYKNHARYYFRRKQNPP